jgi:hypothetical protein
VALKSRILGKVIQICVCARASAPIALAAPQLRRHLASLDFSRWRISLVIPAEKEVFENSAAGIDDCYKPGCSKAVHSAANGFDFSCHRGETTVLGRKADGGQEPEGLDTYATRRARLNSASLQNSAGSCLSNVFQTELAQREHSG